MNERRDHPDAQTHAAGSRKRVRIFIVLAVLAALGVGASLAWPKYVERRQKERVSAENLAIVTAATLSVKEPTKAQMNQAAMMATLNRLLPDVAFTDLDGRKGTLREYRGKVIVISITSADCPISKKLVPALSKLAADYPEGRVQFLLVNSDEDLTRSELESHAALLPGWRYVQDGNLELMQALEARTTTETFVLDEAQTLQYRGCVDDRYDIRVTRPVAGTSYLRDAIESVLRQEPVKVMMTAAPGCAVNVESSPKPETQVTWFNQISRLIQANCVECHRPGEAAPFALETYEQVVARRSRIKYVLEEGIMPPWFADHSYGRWRNERFLSPEDRQMFFDWIGAGFPKGDSADAPMQVKYADGWTIREPDIVIDVGAQEVPADGFVEWRKFPVEFSVTNDLWVSEAEIRPSVSEVVHHAMLFVEYPQDDPRRLTQTEAESEDSGGGNGFWLSYFPGRKAMILPPGRGKLIPKGGRIFIQLHYNPNGTAVVDKTRVGFKILPEPPERAVISGSIVKDDFTIPPNSHVQFLHSEVFDEDVRLVALMPHLHSRGASAAVYLKGADGTSETLLNVPKYDFNWQVAYEFSEPLFVERGSRIVIQHAYDNTGKNPQNPDASKSVRHGMATSDEMMINFFDWEPAGDNLQSQGKTRRPFR